MILIFLPLALFIVLVILVVIVGKRKPVLIYSDTGGSGRVLSDKELMVRGKPDEVWKLPNGTYWIVEHKSGVCKSEYAYPSDQLQLALYMHLIEKHYRAKKVVGEIRYRNRNYPVEWNGSLKQKLYQTIEEMRKAERTQATEFKVDLRKCRHCEFYQVSCEKSG